MSEGPSVQQRRAIEAPMGPVLVVAGPGAGKTYCLTGRIAHLIGCLGFEPGRILAVTFTNKAAEEIAARLHALPTLDGATVMGGTLHSLCASILREYAEAAGLRPGFGIVDEDYQRRVLRQLRVELERQRRVLECFGHHRLAWHVLTGSDRDLFARYVQLLRDRNVVDFDDLISLTWALLHTHESIANTVRSRWDYVLVDELQDLNLAQYGILRSLSSAHRNLFGVGDDEQSIFSWAGADADILGRFRDDLGVAHIALEHNRRCSIRIFDVARRLIAHNKSRFMKQIEATRESPFEVEARIFPDEGAEADWLITDIFEDRARHDLGWGEFAILYRKHEQGRYLEGRLLRDNVPCKFARGQALMDDRVVAYVIRSLHVMRSPDDPILLEALAEQALGANLLQEVWAQCGRAQSLMSGLRIFATSRNKGDASAKKVWRFIYQVENLRALERTHSTLESIVSELLSQRVGPARNPLEERYEELTDPDVYLGARALADRLRTTADSGARVWLVPDRGVEIALLAMLRAGGVPSVARLVPGEAPAPGDVVLRSSEVRHGRWPLLLFKALQLLHPPARLDDLRDYVTFDLETTDKDVRACEIVEIAAVRVRGGTIVDRFESLVRPQRPISPGATKIHGYTDADVRDAPSFEAVWHRFRAFVGIDTLVAHNGQKFDVPVLRRAAEPFDGGAEELVFYDTLLLAKSLSRQSATLENLAGRFNVEQGRLHHALDDAVTLAEVFPRLKTLEAIRARTAAQVHLLDFLGLALALDRAPDPSPEERLLADLCRPFTLGRYSDCLDLYAAELGAMGAGDAPSLEEAIELLGGQALLERIRVQRSPSERYPVAASRLEMLMEASKGDTLADRVDDLLVRATLSRSSSEVEADPNRLNLLTLHSTKGLEFSRVYIMGVEDQLIPGWRAMHDGLTHEIDEARRLLYVGMTRAKDRLILTRVLQRAGRSAGGDLFIYEAGLRH